MSCCGQGNTYCSTTVYAKCESQPLKATQGFNINDQLYTTYTSWTPFSPTLSVGNLISSVGTQWKQEGDQVILNLNLLFYVDAPIDTLQIEGLPKSILTATLPGAGVMLESVVDSTILIHGGLHTDPGDLTVLELQTETNMLADTVYALNAQIVYSTPA